jgi:uncharacterized damage-inducible protein DinB
MITPRYAQAMAAYNRWQNESLYGAASTLDEEERRRDRGAFFGSIHKTLNHILWGDEVWLSRLGGFPAPAIATIGESTNYFEEWVDLRAARARTDELIAGWARALSTTDLEGDFTWSPSLASAHAGAANREITRPRWLLVVHLFNHQTHHRGQVHAMLTAAGARPAATDIQFMPPGYAVDVMSPPTIPS